MFTDVHLTCHGSPTEDRGFCSKQWIRQWADREVSPEEIARLQLQETQSQEFEHNMDWSTVFFRNIPDELLIAEVQRRG